MVAAKTDRAHEGLAAPVRRSYRSIGAIRRSSPAGPLPAEGTVDAPLARSPANRKKIAIVAERQARGDALPDLAAAQRCRPGRMPARNRPHPPGARPHGFDRPSACLATRFMVRTKPGHRQVLETLHFRRQALHAARLGFIHPVTSTRFVVRKRNAGGYAGTVRYTLSYRFMRAYAPLSRDCAQGKGD